MPQRQEILHQSCGRIILTNGNHGTTFQSSVWLFPSEKGGRVITRQKMTYCKVFLAVFGSLIFFPPDSHAADQEVDPTFRGRQIDEVFFGLDHSASSLAHQEILIGEMQPSTFSLKAPHHEVSWDLTALKGWMHVLLIDCIILSEERAATPSYMNFSGDWVELPRMPFRSPWYDHNKRYYLIDLPPHKIGVKS